MSISKQRWYNLLIWTICIIIVYFTQQYQIIHNALLLFLSYYVIDNIREDYKIKKSLQETNDNIELVISTTYDSLNVIKSDIQTLDENIQLIVKHITKIQKQIKQLEQDAKEKDKRDNKERREKQRVIRSRESYSQGEESELL